jgi:hypothetical protein
MRNCAAWCVSFQNTGAGAVTLSPNGHNLDGSSSNLTLDFHDGLMIVTDGSNYFSIGGAGRRATVTTGTTDCLSNFNTGGCTNIGTTEAAFASSYTVKNGAMFTNRARTAQFCSIETAAASATAITFQLRWGGISGAVLYRSVSVNPSTTITNRGGCMKFVLFGMAAGKARRTWPGTRMERARWRERPRKTRRSSPSRSRRTPTRRSCSPLPTPTPGTTKS